MYIVLFDNNVAVLFIVFIVFYDCVQTTCACGIVYKCPNTSLGLLP